MIVQTKQHKGGARVIILKDGMKGFGLGWESIRGAFSDHLFYLHFVAPFYAVLYSKEFTGGMSLENHHFCYIPPLNLK